MTGVITWSGRVLAAHPRLFVACGVGLAAFLLLPHSLDPSQRAVLAWDLGCCTLLVLVGAMFWAEGNDDAIARNAEAQQEGEWVVFGITLAGVAVSFAALSTVMGSAKDMQGAQRKVFVGLVAATLLLSWLVTHVVFALRYAHEYYQCEPRRREPSRPGIDGGLEFPGDLPPDYWDFAYFALVLGMTFQVSDVQITSRKMRRLATVHGLIGFLFNTVIVALTVNIAASLL